MRALFFRPFVCCCHCCFDCFFSDPGVPLLATWLVAPGGLDEGMREGGGHVRGTAGAVAILVAVVGLAWLGLAWLGLAWPGLA